MTTSHDITITPPDLVLAIRDEMDAAALVGPVREEEFA